MIQGLLSKLNKLFEDFSTNEKAAILFGWIGVMLITFAMCISFGTVIPLFVGMGICCLTTGLLLLTIGSNLI